MVNKYSKLVLSLAIALLLTGANFAEGKTKSEEYVNDAIQKYNVSLRHDNKGIVETSMFNLMQVKAIYPNAKFKKTLNELDRLVDKGATVEIRYKAFLALNYFNTDEWKNLVETRSQAEINEVFSEISKDLESSFFEVSAK